MPRGRGYEKSFQLGAARLVVEQGYSQAEAARRVGVTPTTIKAWLKKFQESGELDSQSDTRSQAEELARLRSENQRLRMEADILKKAAAYFAKNST